MPTDARYYATVPCSDFERAKAFYADKLGLTPVEERADAVFYEGRNGSCFLLYPSAGSASGTHTQLGMSVDDIDATVRELKERGVRFEEYDLPGFDKATGIAQTGDVRGAWFKDSEGNLVGVVQLA
jgi:catechol 2,3-dioxygenase-like lactoylglutathione lyase family enzyme